MASTSKSFKFGVGERLLLAFLGIGAFSLIASASGFYSLSQVRGALTHITEERVPQALSLLELSRQAERVVSSAPALLVVTTVAEREKVAADIAAKVELLNALVQRINDAPGDNPNLLVKNIASLVERFNSTLESVGELVNKRSSTVSVREKRIKLLTRIHSTSIRLVSPGLKLLDAQTSVWNRDETSSGEAALSEKQTKQARSIIELIPQQKIIALIDAVYNKLLEIVAADSKSKIDVLAFPLNRSFQKLVEISETMPDRVKKRMRIQIENLKTLVEGDLSLGAVRGTELHYIKNARILLQITKKHAVQLTKEVGWLVKNSTDDIDQARTQAAAVQSLNTNILIGVMVLGFISSIMIFWLYVGRNLIARLTGLSNSMLAIADGNLRTPLPDTGGSDEITEMSKALVVFRDTAIEVKESNLKEIEDARRRLEDAIENTSEGFAFYDPNDALVLCNERYKELMYFDDGQDFCPESGMSFEEIIRQSAEGGNIFDAEENIEEWLATRIEKHRNPGEPQLQHRRNGRWILVSERKTGDDGTVAIYSDITDLKQREQELATKSNALEQLSTQLAKYLSPQVYDSIFSGRQEVKLASERKRLTIFFSDIAGFTAITEKLESEDLTRLLNHYLTEMSNIALHYGATIDKYIGDAIVIFFGDPETLGVREDALACVKMALAMRNKMSELQTLWSESGVEDPLKCRMGINTGMCTVGNFGSDDRMDYTIIGGGVNLAARLESACKIEEILISYETYSHIKDEIFCEKYADLEVKGIAQPVATYQVIDLHENLNKEVQPIHLKSAHFQLDINFTSMSLQEQKQAITALRESVELLSPSKVTKQLS